MKEGLNNILSHDQVGLKIRINTDPRTLLLLLAFCEKNIVRYFVLTLSMIPLIGTLSKIVIPTAYIVLLFIYFRKYGAHISIQELCVVIFVFLSIAFTCLLYPENAKYILDSNNFWNTIFPCLRYYIIGLIFIPDSKTMNVIGKASCLAILVETLFVIAYMMPNGLVQSDDMSRAYQILPNVLFAINYSINNRKVFPKIISAIGIIYCLSMGTRGPVIILLIFVFLRLLLLEKQRRKRIIVLAVVILLIVFAIFDLFTPILKSFRTLLSQLGLSTRVVDFAIRGTMTSYLSGRDNIYNVVFDKILERPFLGYGVYGEWNWIGWSAHNIALELMANFGIIIGSTIFLWMVYLSLKSYLKTPNGVAKEMILIWACFVFVRGIFGGSYLQFGVFVLVGFCLRELRRIKSHFYS